MMWLWDLSERLGWADGSHAGSWQAGGSHQRLDQGGGPGPGSRSGSGGGSHMDEHDFELGPLALGVVEAPFEVWCPAAAEEAAPLHYHPPAAAWVAHNRVVALGGLAPEDKQALFPRHAHGNNYPSNSIVVATLC